MKHFLYIIILLLNYQITLTAIPLSKLEGTWYIHKSNFKMWLKKHNHNPRFNYSIDKKDGIERLKDVVTYKKRKKAKEIKGYDRVLNENNTAFEWQGKGILALFKSKWEIIYYDNDFVIIHFQKTLFTAGGYDVISHQKNLSPAVHELVDRVITELGIRQHLSPVQQDQDHPQQ